MAKHLTIGAILSLDRKCSLCCEIKPLSLFKRDKHRKDGYSSWCKQCYNIKNVEYVKRDRTKANKSTLKYNKTVKGKLVKSKYRKSEKYKEVRRIYNNGDVGYAAAARWRTNRRLNNEAIKELSTLTHGEWLEILESQQHRCKMCGVKFNHTNIMTRSERDHIIPLSLGGALNKNNVQALCRSCNSSKGAKVLWDEEGKLIDRPHYELVT